MRNPFLILLIALFLNDARLAPAQFPNMAPTIADILAPVVGNADTTLSGKFIFPDALDLNFMVTDDITAPVALKWSYTILGAPRYLINGVGPINPAVTNPLNPPLASQINRTVAGGEVNFDGKPNTITIRNKALSPLGGSTTTPATPGIVPSETQVVTFFCSDGNAYSSSTVFFYTDNGGSDRLSSPPPPEPWQPIYTSSWPANPAEWPLALPGNHISRSAWPVVGGASGICLSGTLTGNNFGSVISPFPYFNLAMNQVYRIGMKMVCSQATGDKMPLWDINLENFEPHTGRGLNLYGMDTMFLANEGAANALDNKGSIVTWYWTPPAVATPQWSNAGTGAFTAARDAHNDPRLRFRLLDVDAATGSQSHLKSGAVCILALELTAAPLDRARVVRNLVNITKLVDHGAAGGNVECVPLVASWSQAVFATGTLTVEPVNDGRMMNMTDIRPATDATFSMDPANPASQDNFPIAWKTGKILRLQVGLSAPTTTDEAHPWDAVSLIFNTMTNEINAESIQTSNLGIGSPKAGAPQTYTMFFNTGNETKSTVPGLHRLRWQVRVMNHDSARFPDGKTYYNTGRVRVHSIKVDEVTFQ